VAFGLACGSKYRRGVLEGKYNLFLHEVFYLPSAQYCFMSSN
jgi:hypothetical protein